MKKLKTSADNRKSRLYYVEYWANYVKTNPDKVWSKQQNILINSVFKNSRNSKLTKEQYLKIKGESRSSISIFFFLFLTISNV